MAKFDLSKTEALTRLFAEPRERRDHAWRAAFFDAIVDGSMATTPSQLMQGPDGFPYFVLQLPPVGESFTPFCVSHVLEHCTDHGYGVVVEPGKGQPQWVFRYGDLFSLRAYGSFDGDPADTGNGQGAGTEVVAKKTPVMVGAPSEAMLPAWARRVIAAFLTRNASVTEPKVLVMVDPSRAPGRDLVFNVHPQDFPSEAAFEAVMQALSWFVPARRSVVAISKTSGLVDSFTPLT
jgi:hypothetical protein